RIVRTSVQRPWSFVGREVTVCAVSPRIPTTSWNYNRALFPRYDTPLPQLPQGPGRESRARGRTTTARAHSEVEDTAGVVTTVSDYRLASPSSSALPGTWSLIWPA